MLTALAFALLQAASPVDPTPAPRPAASTLESDLSCLAALSVAIMQVPADKRDAAATTITYFLGRIDAQAPGHDLETAMRRVTSSTGWSARIGAEISRCATIVETRGTALQALGRALADDKRPSR